MYNIIFALLKIEKNKNKNKYRQRFRSPRKGC